MNLRFLFFVMLVAASSLAHAQQAASPPPSPELQALSNKLLEELQSNIQLRAQLIALQAQMKTVADENAHLKASVKAEAKPVEPAKK